MSDEAMARAGLVPPAKNAGLKVASVDTNPMKGVVLNKLASGTSPHDFNPTEAEAYSKLSTTEINAAKEQYLRNAGAKAMDQASLVPAAKATKAADLGTNSVPDPTKFTLKGIAGSPALQGYAGRVATALNGATVPTVSSAPATPPATSPATSPVPPEFVVPEAVDTPTVGGIGAADAATRQAAMAALLAEPKTVPAEPAEPTGQQMPDGKEIAKLDGKKLATIIGAIADALGSGFAGYAGRSSPTMLTRHAQAQMELQNEIAKAEAMGRIQTKTATDTATALNPLEIGKAKALAAAQTDEQIRARLALLEPETAAQIESALAIARATGDIQRENAIKLYLAQYPYEMNKIDLERKYGVAGARSPTQLAQSVMGGK